MNDPNCFCSIAYKSFEVRILHSEVHILYTCTGCGKVLEKVVRVSQMEEKKEEKAMKVAG